MENADTPGMWSLPEVEWAWAVVEGRGALIRATGLGIDGGGEYTFFAVLRVATSRARGMVAGAVRRLRAAVRAAAFSCLSRAATLVRRADLARFRRVTSVPTGQPRMRAASRLVWPST